MAAAATIHRANDRKLIRQLRVFRQKLAHMHARQRGADRAKRATLDEGLIGLGIERINVARPAGHPQENHRLATSHRPADLCGLRTKAQKFGQRQPSHACETRLEHAAPAERGEPFPGASMKICKRVRFPLPFNHAVTIRPFAPPHKTVTTNANSLKLLTTVSVYKVVHRRMEEHWGTEQVG